MKTIKFIGEHPPHGLLVWEGQQGGLCMGFSVPGGLAWLELTAADALIEFRELIDAAIVRRRGLQ